MKKVYVNVSKPYDVLIGRGIFENISELIQPVCLSKRVAVVTDDVVAGLYLNKLINNFKIAGFETFTYVFTNGEKSKNMNTLSDILEFLAVNHIRRNDTLIALGGGVVGDIVGLAAAVYMRGISVIQIPTTLLSAVDSSVGGKTAVDLKNGKNLAGAFQQPSMVICDVDVVEHLPDSVFAEGMAEVIKCNVIKNLPIIEWIEEGNLKSHLDEVIYECVTLKRDVVEQDEFDEKGIRNILNVGHTVAHAIEKLSGYTVSHGHAVGTGMILESKMAQLLNLCDATTIKRIELAVDHYNLGIDVPWMFSEMTDVMMNDKKNRDARIVFELPYELGNCREIKLKKEETVKLFKRILNEV